MILKKLNALSIALALTMILAFAQVGFCIEWHTLNQATVAWDAVTELLNDEPVPTDNIIKYRIYLADTNLQSGPGSILNPSIIGETENTSYTITLTSEGNFYIALQAVRYAADGTEIVGCLDQNGQLTSCASGLNWSNENGENTPNPFGFVRWFRLKTPTNLR